MTQTLFGDVNAGFRDIIIIRMLRPITPPASIAAELLILPGCDKRLIAVVAELDRYIAGNKVIIFGLVIDSIHDTIGEYAEKKQIEDVFIASQSGKIK